MKRTFTAMENEFVSDFWHNGIGYREMAKTPDSKPGTIVTIFRDIDSTGPDVRKPTSAHLTLADGSMSEG
ncbi:hypothetical protein FJU30_10925 [Affinibrenneria salicis]|uniref:Uncharacterized protein n=1 Tax=Affinibrenneria salicis TaxID=2590031 RepID=A0A5J5G1V4_9GAMM|nr:hypothetical protein [Affinibrenneria salicis]KAA9000714.1 hypothetical protein FJU30_10925 [Affinibrenneria salicis]